MCKQCIVYTCVCGGKLHGCNLHCHRYKLLLTDLLKNTLPDDDDYAALTGT